MHSPEFVFPAGYMKTLPADSSDLEDCSSIWLVSAATHDMHTVNVFYVDVHTQNLDYLSGALRTIKSVACHSNETIRKNVRPGKTVDLHAFWKQFCSTSFEK